MALTGRAALLALLGVPVAAAMAPGLGGVLLVLAVLAVSVGADVALAPSPGSLRLGRDGDSAVRLGETASVRLTLANPGRRRVRCVLRDAWPPSAGAHATRTRLDVPAGERRRHAVALTPTRRGDRFAAGVTVRVVGPLGLAARQRTVAVPWRLRVLPPFRSRRHLPAALARLRELDGRSAVQVRSAGTEFDSLRDYVDGDDVRSVDWRATARRGGVVVRTWRPERDRRVVLVLDTGRTSAGRVGDAPRLDTSLDAALLLAAVATRAGDRVDLLAYDRTVQARIERPAPQDVLPRLVQAMADLEPALVETDHRGLVGAVLGRGGRRALVVLFTDLDAAAVEEGWGPVLGLLTARHRVVLAAVADPRVAAMAHGGGTAADVYAAAAAERDRGERARVADRLSHRGVQVVDAVPDQLPPRLCDAYLALKAAGRL